MKIDVFCEHWKQRLNSVREFEHANGDETMRMSETWWFWYKDFEKKDRFELGFQQGHMTVL